MSIQKGVTHAGHSLLKSRAKDATVPQIVRDEGEDMAAEGRIGWRSVLKLAVFWMLTPFLTFGAVGRLDWWAGWAVVALTAVGGGVASRLVLAWKIPELVAGRARFDEKRDVKPWDRVLMHQGGIVREDVSKGTNKGSKRTALASDVDGYLAALPEETRGTLEKLRAAIKAAAPEADEVISYQIPAYKYHGPLVFFAAFKNHCSLYVVSKSILQTFSDELAPYKTSGTTIHFTAKNPLPATLVKKIVKTRIEENESRARQKQDKR